MYFKLNLGHYSIHIMKFSSNVIFFLLVSKDCELSLLLTSVSTLFLVVRFDTEEGQMIAMVEAPQPLVLSFCSEDT